ncbi:oligosaccharide flippase family protein [Terriglobus albidus]|uniref:oligosaccharide flippase family protein n=1 Tax=Terriglobus albidus TaxID=1592106 RepID=UPI0021DFAAD0|nr:oligosaccharide flippase family protein [Terriglobus albidus]
MPTYQATTSVSGDGIAQLRRRSAEGLALLLTRNGITIALNLLGTILLTRAAGPQLWGAFSAALFLYLMAQEVLVRGLAGHLIRMPEEPSRFEIRSTFALCNLAGLFVLLLCVLSRPFATRFYPVPGIYMLLLAGGVACWATAWRAPSIAMLERRLSYRRVLAIEVLDTALFALSGVLLIHLLPVWQALAAALALRGIAPALLAFALQPFPVGAWPDLHHLREITHFGTVMSGISLISVGAMAMPPLILAPLAGPRALGLLQLTFSILGNLFFAASALLRLSLSTYARMEHLDHIHNDVAEKMRILPQLLGPPICVVLGGSSWLIPALFGAKWIDIPPLLLLAVPGYLLAATVWPVMSGALLAKDPRQALLFVPLIQAIVLALTILLTAHRWGAASGALGYTLGQLASLLPLFLLFRRTFRLPPVTGPLATVLVWSIVAVLLHRLATQSKVGIWCLVSCVILVFWGFRQVPHGLRALLPAREGSSA